MPEFKLELGSSLPGEALLVAILNYAAKYRETMSQVNRDNFDKLQISQLQGWHNFWVEKLGWPGEKVNF